MVRYTLQTEYRRKKEWCEARGWTEPFFENNRWYAFPPNAVITLAISQTWSDYRLIISQLFGFLLYRLLMLGIIYTILELIATFLEHIT